MTDDDHKCALCNCDVEPPADFVEGMGDALVCLWCEIDHAEVIAQAEKKRELN